MNTLTLWKISTLTLAGALAFTAGNQIYEAQAEAQPQMVDALKALKDAKAHLAKASHDKGGHRAKALKLTDEAIVETKKGIAHDDKKKSVEPELDTELEPDAQ